MCLLSVQRLPPRCKGICCSRTAIIRAKCGGLTQYSPLNLEPFDTHDKSVTPQGSHLSVESSLNCVPSATGHSHWKKQLAREKNRNACVVRQHHSYVFHAWVPSLLPVYSIRSTLENHLDQKELPPLLGLEVLPEEITLGQGPDVWRAAMEFKRRWPKEDDPFHLFTLNTSF